jgi:hypothetical protein
MALRAVQKRYSRSMSSGTGHVGVVLRGWLTFCRVVGSLDSGGVLYRMFITAFSADRDLGRSNLGPDFVRRPVTERGSRVVNGTWGLWRLIIGQPARCGRKATGGKESSCCHATSNSEHFASGSRQIIRE